ncbi:MAG: HPF/RaiA family ribosome-associated protein [Rhodopirellula sp.]|nr:HPF/RaiA family ribosome-associated protein [Rhodopirellula sp.]
MPIHAPVKKPARHLPIRLRHRGFTASEPLREHAERRLSSALGRFAARIGEVNIHLAVSKAAERISENSCRIAVRFRGNRSVVVVGRHADLYEAIAIAAKRAAKAAERDATRRLARRGRTVRPIAVAADENLHFIEEEV